MFSNRYLWAAIGLTIVLMLLAVYLPVSHLILKTVAPSLAEWTVVLIAALSPAVIVETYKVIKG